jgi:ATP-dependent exoDNAse (exonuclease V) beta subunit
MAALPDRAALFDEGPHGWPEFARLHADLRALRDWPAAAPARAQQLRRRLEAYFLTRQGTPRRKLPRAATSAMFPSAGARARHEAALKDVAPLVAAAIAAFDADVGALLARGVLRVLMIAVATYERLLDEHALLDFAGMLSRAVRLLERQEEFARSRLKLQARYHHVLVDEFQDTSRLQWRLISLLIDAWGEGEGAADAPTSIFVVGDRKQSIYRFRHAEVTLLDEAAKKIGALRPMRPVRQTITASYRAVPELLAFVNALSEDIQGPSDLPERFRYAASDRFPVADVGPGARRDGQPVLGVIAERTMRHCASAMAVEIERLLAGGVVRDRHGPARPVRPDDIAILFRARTGHQLFEEAIEARGIRTYVYKGLGFFDAPEVQDLQALLRFLARPESDRRAAEWLRSRMLRLSDPALARLAPSFARALRDPDAVAPLDPQDAAMLERARAASRRWLSLADRLPPAELVDLALRESVYAFELRGRRGRQARENVKKARALIRRVANRGYTTLDRLAAYFDTLRAGEESNAVIEAEGAVNLMTIHAAKGLEFPIVFVANLHVAGRSRSGGFSVIERGPEGEPAVSFGSSAATALEDRRETEELRRLLYVAVTRARDRLYLVSETEDAGLKRGHRSLAALLPESLAAMFATIAAVPTADVRWTHSSGTFDFRVCRPPSSAEVQPRDAAARSPAVRGVRFDRDGGMGAGHQIVHASDGRAAASTMVAAGADPAAWARHAALPPEPRPAVDRLLGTVVHRLLQRGLDPALDRRAIAGQVPALVRPAELVDIEDRETFAAAAAALFLRIRDRADVAALLARGQCLYEVPFTTARADAPGVLVRGVIDCVVVTPEGRATLVEFKTGRPRPEHEAQAAICAAALRGALGIAAVDVKIVYA